jgi:hypothetical protein
VRVTRISSFVLVLAPAVGHACGMCTDVLMKRDHWWVAALGPIGVVALLECFVWFVVSVAKRRLKLSEAILPLVPLPIFLFAPSVALGAVAVVIIIQRAFAAFRPPRSTHAALSLAALSFFAATSMWMAMPGLVSGKSLIHLSTRSPMLDWSLEPKNWAEKQLTQRTDTVHNIEHAYEGLRSDEVPAPSPHQAEVREVALLRLHFIYGGPPEFRAKECAGLDFRGFNERFGASHRSGPPPDDAWIKRVCG